MTWVRALEEPVERFLSTYRVPLAAAAFVAAGTLWVYAIMVAQQGAQLGRLVDARTTQLRSEALLQLQLRADALDQIARLWEGRANVDLEVWSRDAESLLLRNMQFRAVAWLGPDLGMVAVQPTTARLTAWALDPADDEERLRQMSAMAPETGTTISRSYLLAGGGAQIMVRAPMHGPDGRTAFLIAVLRMRDLADVLAGPAIRQGYAVAVFDGAAQVFGPPWTEAGEEAKWTREAEVVSGDLGLRLRLWPSAELARELRSSAPPAVLVAGLFLALVIALLVRRIEVLSDRLEARR